MPEPLPFVLIVARHGATTEPGARSLFNANEDPPLTSYGIAQAARLAHLFSDSIPHALQLYTSPKKRARQTLAPFAARWSLPVHVAHVLDELHYGRWAGVDKQAIAAQAPSALWDWDRHGIEPKDAGFVPDAATADADVRRFCRARAVDGRPLLCMSHSGRLRSFYALAPDDDHRRGKMSVGNVGVLALPRAGAPWERWTWDVAPERAQACLLDRAGSIFVG